jgi:hypothetical protein
MKTNAFPWVGLLILALCGCDRSEMGAATVATLPTAAAHAPTAGSVARAALPFLANVGQVDTDVDFYARTFASTVFVTGSGSIVYSLPCESGGGVALEESFVGGFQVRARGHERSTARIHAYAGRNPAQWRTDIPSYKSVRLASLYDGVDLELRARGDSVEKLFFVKPGADPAAIRVRVDGARALRTNAGGALEVETERGTATFTPPVAYQGSEAVTVAYEVSGNEYGFRVTGHDPSRELVIDPILESTFLGGAYVNPENVRDVLLDASGNVFVVGETPSSDFPHTAGTYRGGNYDAFVARLSPDLSSLVAGVFLGGSRDDQALAAAMDGTHLFVAGITNSFNFTATSGAFDGDFNTVPGINSMASDVFVARFQTLNLALSAATFFGGRKHEMLYDLELDGVGNVFLTGTTSSNEDTSLPQSGHFPLLGNGLDHTFGVGTDGFVAKLSNDLTTGLASTYLDGAGGGLPHGLEIDQDDEVLVGGSGSSSGFSYDATLGPGGGFLSRLSNDLATLERSVLTGDVRGLVVDKEGDLVVAGQTGGGYPTTAGAYDGTHNGGNDVYVARIDAGLTTIEAATYLGGSTNDSFALIRAGLAIDSAGGILVGGRTDSADFPTTASAHSTMHAGNTDAFVAKLSASLTDLDYSTYLGGSETEDLSALAVDAEDNAVAAGLTLSADFPVSAGAYQTSPNITLPGGSDGFVTRLKTRDGDRDGVVDVDEMGPDTDDPTYDGNADGTADHEQDNVCSFFTFNRQDYVTIECPPGAQLVGVEAVETPLQSSPPGVRFSFDLFRFCVLVANPGDSVQVTVHLPVSPNSYYKYGKTQAGRQRPAGRRQGDGPRRAGIRGGGGRRRRLLLHRDSGLWLLPAPRGAGAAGLPRRLAGDERARTLSRALLLPPLAAARGLHPGASGAPGGHAFRAHAGGVWRQVPVGHASARCRGRLVVAAAAAVPSLRSRRGGGRPMRGAPVTPPPLPCPPNYWAARLPGLFPAGRAQRSPPQSGFHRRQTYGRGPPSGQPGS